MRIPQLHGPGGHTPPIENIVVSVCGSRVICIPALLAAVWYACTSASSVGDPVENIILKDSIRPFAIPAPRSAAGHVAARPGGPAVRGQQRAGRGDRVGVRIGLLRGLMSGEPGRLATGP